MPEPYPIIQYYEKIISDCSLYEIPNDRAPVKVYLLCLSSTLFDSIQILPFLTSLGILPVSFMVMRKITKSYAASSLTVTMLLTSEVYSLLGMTASLSADWVFFMLLSIYFMYTKPVLSGPFLLLSIGAKALSLVMVPVLLYWNYKADIPKRQKKINFISIGLIVLFVCGVWLGGDSLILQQNGLSFDLGDLDFNALGFMFRHDLAVMLIIPVSLINLGVMAFRYKHHEARMLFVSILWLYSLVLILPVFTIYMMYDYRMILMIVFVMMGFGMISVNPWLRKKNQ